MSDVVSVDREAWERSMDALIRQDAEIVRLKALLGEAASWFFDHAYEKWPDDSPTKDLLKRIREAAQTREATKR